MNLKRIVQKAVSAKPLPSLSWLYGDYYSPYYSLMYLLAKTIDNGLLVELGVHKGRGVASLAAADNNNITVGIDTEYPHELDIILGKFPILFCNQSSMPVPQFFTYLKHKSINLLHIDTEHSHAMARAEFEAYQPYLAKGAYVLFDDLHAIEDEVLRYFQSLPYEKVQDDRLHPSCGYGVMIYE